MDGISSVSAVLGIASFGLQLYETLKKFANKVAEAPQYLLWLATDLDLSVAALHSVQELLEREEQIRKRGQGRRLFSDKALIDTWRASDQCMVIFRSIVEFILKKGKKGTEEVVLNDRHPDYLRLNQKVLLSSLGRVNWALAQDDVERLTNRLSTFKLTLNLIVSVVSVKAQNPDSNIRRIVHDQAFKDEVARIDAFLKARNKAQEKWVLLQASILRQRTKPSPRSSISSIQSQRQLASGQPPSPTPKVTQSQSSNSHLAPSLGFAHIDPQKSFSPAGVTSSLALKQNSPDPQIGSGANGVLGSFSPPPIINTKHPTLGDAAESGTRPDQNLANGSGSQSNLAEVQTSPATRPALSATSTGFPNVNPGDTKSPQTGSNSSPSSRSNKNEHTQSESKNSTMTKETEKREEWLSIEAWLYKDSIARELRYSESRIRDLWGDTSRQSSKQLLQIFTSLTAEEHAGIDEAMDSRQPNDTRKLLSVQVHSARGAAIFRIFLRLCSLGLLDSNHLETRALLIIIGNKNTLGLEDGPYPHHQAPSPQRLEDTVERREPLRMVLAHTAQERLRNSQERHSSSKQSHMLEDEGMAVDIPLHPGVGRRRGPFPAKLAGKKKKEAAKSSNVSNDETELHVEEHVKKQAKKSPQEEAVTKSHQSAPNINHQDFLQIREQRPVAINLGSDAVTSLSERKQTERKEKQPIFASQILQDPAAGENFDWRRVDPMVQNYADRPPQRPSNQSLPMPLPLYPQQDYYGYPPLPLYGSPPPPHVVPPATVNKLYYSDARQSSPTVIRPAINDAFPHEHGQSSKSEGKRRRESPPVMKKYNKDKKKEQKANLRGRASYDSIMSWETTLDSNGAGGGPDEEQIQKLFAMWTPDGDDIINRDSKARASSIASDRGARDMDLKKASDAELGHRVEVDVLNKGSKTLVTSRERGRSRSRRSGISTSATAESDSNVVVPKDPARKQGNLGASQSRVSKGHEGSPSPERSLQSMWNWDKRQSPSPKPPDEVKQSVETEDKAVQ